MNSKAFPFGSHILTLSGDNCNPLNLQNICGFYCVVFVQIMPCTIRQFSCRVWLDFSAGITLRRNPSLPTRGNVAGVLPVRCFIRPKGRAFSGSAESEGCVSIKVSCKEIPCCCKFITHESQSHQPCSHCKFRIFGLLWLGACCSQVFCHLT